MASPKFPSKMAASLVLAALGLAAYACGGGSSAVAGGLGDASVDDAGSDAREGGGGILPFDAGRDDDQFNGIIDDDAGPPNGDPGGSTSELYCGTSTCPIPDDECCVALDRDASAGFVFTCTGSGPCPHRDGGSAGVPLHCSGAENCATGRVCCLDDLGQGTEAVCETSCAGALVQLCYSKSHANECQTGFCTNQQSAQYNLPLTYGTCGSKPQ